MYILVHHTVHDPDVFWSTVERSEIPSGLTLHQSIPARDGSRATCLWEGPSVEAVRGFVEPLVGSAATNEYSEAENREGVAMPSMPSATRAS